ncbi:hypothetical protein [Trichloromonas sp.]|uniref:hypothetical protein n=1 Tax=Trichloromonas sp. TaxID=3069249 RepID=UPI002A49A6AC|nr:hypothetical protein [Trichloromonas sp.]
MKVEYTLDDMKSLFDYVKSNINCAFDDWVEHNSKLLTNEEKRYFKFIEISNFKIISNKKEYDFFLIKWNGVGGGHFQEPFKLFIRKYFGDNGHKLYNNHLGEHVLLTTNDDFFIDLDEWEDGECKDSKQLISKIGDVDIVISSSFNIDRDNIEWNSYIDWSNKMEKNNYHFWTINDISIYISNIYNLKYISVLELFKN